MICNNCGANITEITNCECKYCGNSIDSPISDKNKKINYLLELI